MSKKLVVSLLVTLILASAHLAEAQQAKVYRVGVILQGGPLYQVVDGLRGGLKELGLEERETPYLGNPGYKRRSQGGRAGGEES